MAKKDRQAVWTYFSRKEKKQKKTRTDLVYNSFFALVYWPWIMFIVFEWGANSLSILTFVFWQEISLFLFFSNMPWNLWFFLTTNQQKKRICFETNGNRFEARKQNCSQKIKNQIWFEEPIMLFVSMFEFFGSIET